MIIWGVSWASAKMITNYTNFEVILFWRLLVTFVSLVPVLWITKDSFRISKKAIPFVVCGGLVMLFYNALFFLGLRNGFAGAGGVFVTTLNPIFNFFLVAILYKYPIKKIEYFGLTLGLAGGLIILKVWGLSLPALFSGGNVYFLFAAFTWAVLTVITSKSKSYISPVTYSLYLYGIATVVSFCMALPHDWLAPIYFDSIFWWFVFMCCDCGSIWIYPWVLAQRISCRSYTCDVDFAGGVSSYIYSVYGTGCLENCQRKCAH